MAWHDSLLIRTYLSTDGDFVSLGTSTDFPFTPGGTGGVPAGWNAPSYSSGGAPSHVSWSVGSTGMMTVAHVPGQPLPIGVWYFTLRNFTVVPGRRYMAKIRVRTTPDLSSMPWQIRLANSTASIVFATATRTSQSDWEDVTLWTDLIPAGVTTLLVNIGVVISTTATVQASDNWSVQFSNFTLVEQLPSYPDPTWREITRDVKACSTANGRPARLNRYEVATTSLDLVNDDGRYSYLPAHPFNLRPGRFVRGTIGTIEQRFIFPGVVGNYLSIDDRPDLRITGDIDIIMKIPTFPTTSRVVVAKAVVGNIAWQVATVSSSRRLLLLMSSDGTTFTQSSVGTNAPADAYWFRITYEPLTRTLTFYHAPDSENAPHVWRLWQQLVGTPIAAIFPATAPITIGQGINVNPWNTRLPTVIVRKGLNGPVVLLVDETATTFDTGSTFTDFVGNTVHVVTTGTNDIVQTIDHSTPLFYGILDRLTDGYSWDGHAVTTWDIRDVSTLLANMTVPTCSTSEMLSGSRFNVLLSAAGWHPTMRAIDPGAFVQQPILTNGRTVRDELGLIGDSEKGFVYADRSGFITYHDRNWPTTDPLLTTVQCELIAAKSPNVPLPIVDNIPTIANCPVICLRELVPDWSRDRVINSLSIANQGGTARYFTDAESMKRYGPITYQRADLLNSNQHPEYIDQRANDIMVGYTDAVLRINSVSFRVNDDVAALWASKAFLNHLVRIRYVNALSGWGFAIVTHIQAIAHTFTLPTWEVTLTVDDPVSFVTFTFGGDVGWDISLWDVGTWDQVESLV